MLALIEAPAPATPVSTTPLLDYASEQHFSTEPNDAAVLRHRLDTVSHEIARYQPPDSDCAHTLGARRFATLFDDLGSVQSELGNAAEAAAAYEKALSCTPRAQFLLAHLATEMLYLGRFEDARAAIQRAAQPPTAGHYRFDTILAQVDFTEEHWADSITHLRAAVTAAPDDEQAAYWQCFLWLAQKRSGTGHPTLVARKPPEGWPEPILELLEGTLSEQELLDAVKHESNDRRRREILAEALFYTGERRIANGHPDEGRRYLRATANLGVLSFVEHHIAVAELAKP